MTLLDFILIGVMLVSALLAMLRGFTREVLSIGSWAGAGACALIFYKPLTPFFRNYVTNDTLAMGLSALAIFVVTLIVISFITARISDFILDSYIGPLDRSFGFVFGAGRGFLLVVVAFMFFTWLVPDKQQPVWVSQAKSKYWLNNAGEQLLAMLPSEPEKVIKIPGKKQPAAEEKAEEKVEVEKAPPPAQVSKPVVAPEYDGKERKDLKNLIENTAPKN